MKRIFSNPYSKYVVTLISVALYYFLAYHTKREDFPFFILQVILLFGGYVFYTRSHIPNNFLFTAGLVFRLIFLFALPFLSQDYFRFVWDGRLLLHGFNPYLYLPAEIVHPSAAQLSDAQFLVEKMGTLSATNYSNYPPVNQFLFAVGTWVGGKSIVGTAISFKVIILAADIGIFYFGKKILTFLKLPARNIFLFFLNPLIIIELSGNLHFESVMICFMLWSFYLLTKNKPVLAAVIFGLAISVKLLPLLLLPLFFYRLPWKKLIVFYVVSVSTFAITFLPFLSGALLDHYVQTISLWFVSFEFNASIYYLFRAVGFYITGYNIIFIIGPLLSFVSICILLYFSFKKSNRSLHYFFGNMLLALTLYFFLSTTVHPWYLSTLVALSIFTPYRFALLWSGLIFLSYSAYGRDGFAEQFWLIGLEYLLVFSLLIYELVRRKEIIKVQT